MITFLEFVVLAPLAAALALWVIPNAFGIEWSCIGRYGMLTTRGDSFGDAVAVAGTLGWLAVLVGVVYAHIAERPRLAAFLPVVWFVALIGATLVAAAAIGPAPCPS